MSQKYYITTPLYYVNAKPHIGHAYTNVICDAFARYYRLTGKDVFFLTGTDEHGTKIEKKAAEENMSASEYVDYIVPMFKDLWNKLDITYDYFIRTTDQRHKDAVQKILKDLEEKGDIYKARYKGWYSVQDETFYTEQQMRDGLPEEITQDLQEIEEENYFFKLAKYQDWLIEYIEKNPEFVQPDMRKNEILGFLKQPLEDLCITRPRARLQWGIDYPTSEEHVVYVWFDALINYVSAIGYADDPSLYQKLWPADVHVVGKDILRQHAVYWPIMLKAMGLEMPKQVLAHGWWKMQGAKMSKSVGNVVDPLDIVAEYGEDTFRYYLLREVTLGSDGSFSEELVGERYRTDLANDLGNLWHRFASMLNKYFDGKIPNIDAKNLKSIPIHCETLALYGEVAKCMDGAQPKDALAAIWNVITLANQFVEERKPWVLAKDPEKKDVLEETLVVLAECLAHIGVLLQAFLPISAEKILSRLGLGESLKVASEADYTKLLMNAGVEVEKGDPLFPRHEEKV